MKYNSKINVRCGEKLRRELELKAKKEEMKFADYIRWVLRTQVKKE